MPPLSMVDPTYKVAMDARPSNYEVTHISWARPALNLNWFMYVVVRSPNGYPQSPDDGTIIFPDPGNAGWATGSYKDIGVTDDVILRVAEVNTAGTVATSGMDIINPGSANGLVMTAVSPVSVGNLKGKNVTVSILSNTAYVGLGGGDYAVGDYLRIPGNSLKDPTGVSTSTLPGTTSTTQLGVTNTYHLYDNSSTYATTANPGVTAGTNPYSKQYNKYYYSLFAYVAPINSTTAASVSTLINVTGDAHYSDFTWIKIGEASSVVVHQNTTRSTKDVLLDHLPAFYNTKNNTSTNKDLSDFLSLFAFHLDIYLAEAKTLFNMADPALTDEVLLKQFLKQFGSELTQISDLTQARKVLTNIIRNYSLNGSTLGLKNLIESYTGNGVNLLPAMNLLPNYNTSSFVENIGNWYPVPNTTTTGSYDASEPYNYTTTPANVVSPFNNDSVALLLDPAFSTVNISPNVSYLGKLAYTGTGTVTNNYETTAVTSAIVTTSTSPTSVSSYTVVVDDTSKIKLGSIPLVVSSTGTFSAKTVVTYIAKDSKTFKINIPPSVEIPSNATIAFSNSITSNSLSLWAANTSTTRTISFYNGMRKGYTSATTVASTSSIVNGYQYISAIKPNIAKVGDYVSGHSSIPSGTKVIGFGTNATTRTKLSNKLTADLPINTLLNFSSKPSTELGAAVDMIPVSPSTPYAFGIHHNANNGTPKDVSVNLTWYNTTGTIISTTATVSATAVSATYPLPNSANYAKTWYPIYTQDTSPSNAAYVSPGFSIISADGSGTSRYCVDSAFLVRPINIIKKARTSNIATLTTDAPHNFFFDGASKVTITSATGSGTTITYTATNSYTAGQVVSISGLPVTTGANLNIQDAIIATVSGSQFTVGNPNVGTSSGTGQAILNTLAGKIAVVVSDDSSFNTSSATISSVTQDALGNYTFSYVNGSSNPNVASTTTSGYVASFPMVKLSISSTNNQYLTNFQDARESTLEVVANRINLVLNPSFDNDTSSPYDWVTFDSAYSTSVIAVITQSSGNLAHTGTKYLKVSKGVTTPGYLSGVIQSNYMPVSVGKTYTASSYIKWAGAGSPSVKIGIQWTDSSNAIIPVSGNNVVYGTSNVFGSTDLWSRISVTATAPATAVKAKLVVITDNSSTAAIAYGIDGVLFEESTSPLIYFNGDFDGFNYLSTRNSMWQGAPGQSRSHLYKNRALNKDNIDSLAIRGINYA